MKKGSRGDVQLFDHHGGSGDGHHGGGYADAGPGDGGHETFTDGGQLFIGGTGNDHATTGANGDGLYGGAGNDDVTASSGSDSITDWASEDQLFFADGSNAPSGAGTSGSYLESIQADYATALSFANGQIASGVVNYLAIQVGADVIVFADSAGNNGTADSAIMLVGRSLADIAFSDFD